MQISPRSGSAIRSVVQGILCFVLHVRPGSRGHLYRGCCQGTLNGTPAQILSNNQSAYRTLCLLLAQFIIATCAVYGVDTGRESIRAAFHLGYLAELFRTLSAATVMVLLFMLGPGIRHAIHGVPGSLDGVIRYSAYLLGFAVMALAITYYGLLVDYYVNFTNLTGAVTSGWAYPRLKTVNDLISAASIILFAASLVITGLSIATFARSTISPLKSVSSSRHTFCIIPKTLLTPAANARSSPRSSISSPAC